MKKESNTGVSMSGNTHGTHHTSHITHHTHGTHHTPHCLHTTVYTRHTTHTTQHTGWHTGWEYSYLFSPLPDVRPGQRLFVVQERPGADGCLVGILGHPHHHRRPARPYRIEDLGVPVMEEDIPWYTMVRLIIQEGWGGSCVSVLVYIEVLCARWRLAQPYRRV